MTPPTPKYFHHLNYTLGNEDTTIEHAILPERAAHVLAVGGSGSRVVPLLARSPSRVTCVDVSDHQLRLAELRVDAARSLGAGDYRAFWGFPPEPAGRSERQRLFERIGMSAAQREHWTRVFEAQGWDSILYEGRWERTFAKLSRINAALTNRAGEALFEATTGAEHDRLLREAFPRTRWLLTLLLLGNPLMFNLMLYKGGFPRKNIPGTPFEFYRDSFDKLFRLGPARENFFLQVVFFGKLLYAEGNPCECQTAIYDRAQAALAHTQLEFRHGSIFDPPRPGDPPVDFVSCSDVPSYLPPPLEQTFLQQLRRKLAPGALVVLRTYLREPERADASGFDDVTGEYARVIAGEKVGVYQVRVLRHR